MEKFNPSRYFTDLPVVSATAFAQLHTAALGQELARDASHLRGSYSIKKVKDKAHWYFSYREADQTLRQMYVGPDNPQTRQLVEDAKSKAPHSSTQPLAKVASTLGCAVVTRQHLSVILRLNEYGFFRAGGVLIGTHAFLAYSNLLGIRWVSTEQTVGIDFAHAGKNISIALPANVRAEAHAAITTMPEGFLPLVQFRGTAGASYRHKAQAEYQIDFLCPKHSDSDEPIHIPNLDVALQPLRFMEFSLEQVQQTTLMDPTGRCVVVTLPAPERYAVHKLLIIGERTGAFRAKISKDLAQAAALVAYFKTHDPSALAAAWQDALLRGPGWLQRAMGGRAALAAVSAEVADALESNS
jgi:hypothetical protein